MPWPERDNPGGRDASRGHHANGAAGAAAIAGQLDDGLGRRLHEHGVAVMLIGAQHVAQLLRHRDGDVEVGARQKFGFARCNPAFSLITVASRAAPVLARVVGEDLGAAMIAAPQVPAGLFAPAGENAGDGVAVRGQHRRAMCRQIAFREAAKDIRESGHDQPQLSEAGSQIGHLRVEGGLE
jgi:hypothetical protein